MLKENLLTRENSPKEIIKENLSELLENNAIPEKFKNPSEDDVKRDYLIWMEEVFGFLKKGIDSNLFSPALSGKIIYLLKDSLDAISKKDLSIIDNKEMEEILIKAVEGLSE